MGQEKSQGGRSEIVHRTVDAVIVSNEQSERDRNLQQNSNRTSFEGKGARDAARNGRFSYGLEVLTDKPMLPVSSSVGSGKVATQSPDSSDRALRPRVPVARAADARQTGSHGEIPGACQRSVGQVLEVDVVQ